MVEYACPALPSGWGLLVAALPGRQVVHTVLRAGQRGDLGWSDPVALTLPNHRRAAADGGRPMRVDLGMVGR
jgi:hypothetical protein